MNRVELVDECARPVIEHVSDRSVIGDGEGKVQVGEAVAAVHGERAHGGPSNDALILLRQPQHAVTESIPLLNGEHDAGFDFCSVLAILNRELHIGPGAQTMSTVTGSGNTCGVKRLIVFVGAVVLAESAFYAVVPPLVPGLVRALGMSTTEVGILVAAYPAGVLLAALPSIALVNAGGVRTTTTAGLGMLVVATLAFAWSASPLLLDAARFVQGIGGAVAWAGALAWLTSESPAGRRGTTIGGAVGAALVGMVLGPVIGAAASNFGRGIVFSVIALVMTALALASPASPVVPVARPDWIRAVAELFRSTSANLGNGLLLIVGVVNGTVASLVPFLVARRLGDAVMIGAILAATYLVSSFLNVVTGRLSDRLGRLPPTLASLVAAGVIIPFLPHIGSLLALAVATIAASALISGLWAPTAAMVSDGADPGASGQAVGVAILNAAWAAGVSVGAVAVSRLTESYGFTPPFVLVGGLCVVAAAASLVVGYRVTVGGGGGIGWARMWLQPSPSKSLESELTHRSRSLPWR